MSKQAPPLGNLDSTKPTTPAKLPTPVIKELTYTAPPSVKRAPIPSTATFKGVDPLSAAAPTTTGPTEERDLALGVPLIQSIPSTPELPVNSQLVNKLGGDVSDPYAYTGFGAGQVGTEQTQVQPNLGAAKFDSDLGQIAKPVMDSKGTSGVVIQSSAPAYVGQYSTGLTTSQQNSRNFFGSLQSLREYTAPHMLPALQYTPQTLAPGPAGGLAPTAETKGPLSWLIGDTTTDINPSKLEFGASGSGLLGGVGWVFGRIFNTSAVQGIAMDTARGAASIYEGGNAGFSELFKSGNFSKAMGVAEGALLENYEANAPRTRGMYTKTIGGNKAVADFFSDSYFGAGLMGMTDYSLSGNGNNPLITGDAQRNVVNNGENFNPFGVRDPLRAFQTGALEKKERDSGKQGFTHGYDQYLKGGAGLIGDIVLGGRIDKAFGALIKGAIKVAAPVNRVATQAGIKALRNDVPRPLVKGLPQLPGRTQLQLPPAREIPRGTYVTNPTGDVSPLARIPKDAISNGVDNTNRFAMDDYINKARAYYSNKNPTQQQLRDGAGDLMNRRRDYNPPVVQRYLPLGADPFATKVSRVYVPGSGWGGVDFGEGGAIMPRSNTRWTSSVLGVGGQPGDLPSVGVKSTGATPPVTVFDEVSGTFINRGGSSTQEGVFSSSAKARPGAIVDDIIDGEVIDVPQLPQGVSSKAPVPGIDNPTLVTPADKEIYRAGVNNRLNRVKSPEVAPKSINNRTLYKAGNSLDGLPELPKPNTQAPSWTMQGLTDASPPTKVGDELLPSSSLPVNKQPTVDAVDPLGRNTPEVPQAPLPGPVSGLSEAVSDTVVPPTKAKEFTIDPVTGEYTRNRAPIEAPKTSNPLFDDVAWEKAYKEEQAADALTAASDAKFDALLSGKPLPPVVPRNAPNFTVSPASTLSDELVESHVLDPLTGVFSDSDEVIRIATQRSTPAGVLSAGKVSEVVPVPVAKVEYVTAEAISPSVNSADIVRRLTSGDDIPGALYNPRQVERGERTIASLVSLARRVTLPGGVPILTDSIKDISVMKFDRLAKKVEAAIVSSGLNPSSQEAASIRRLFDKNGKALPTNLSPDFSIQVGPRGVDTPTSYVTPAKTVSPDDMWTGRASRYEPEVPLSEDYAIGVRVRYDKELDRIVPLDGGIQGKFMPAVRSEPISGDALRKLPVMDRQALLSRSATDGFTIPKRAIEDAFSPDITVDVVAAKDYVRANIPKGDAPLKLDRATREQLGVHQSIVDDISYHNSLIEDVSSQLTDVEKSLATQLKRIDEQLPDIGTQHLADDVPFSPLPPNGKRNLPQTKLYDVEDIVDTGSLPAPGTTPYGVIGPDGILTLARGNITDNPRNSVLLLTPDEVAVANRQHDVFGYNFSDVPGVDKTLTRITDVDGMTSGIGNVPAGLTDNDISLMFRGGSYLTPSVRQITVDTYEVLSGGDYIAAYKRAMDLDDVVDRMSVRMVNSNTNDVTGAITPANSKPMLYHGTRVQDLQLSAINPLEGAARSEYGTGVWLTTKESVATSAAGRRAPNNHIPNVDRVYSESSFIHQVPSEGLDGLDIVNSIDNVTDNVAGDISVQLGYNRQVFSDHIPYASDLRDDMIALLDGTFSKPVAYGDLFGEIDNLVHKSAMRATGSRADEFELTYVQRVFTDMLESAGVDGITNGTNTALYNTRNLTSRVHDVTDIVGDTTDEVALALHNVNLLQASSDAAPSSMLLKVQLEEAKAVAASRIRDGLSDELDNLNAYKSKAVSDLLDQDDVIQRIGKTQQSEALLEATVRNDDTHAKFTKELNRDFNGPCL